MPEGTLAVLDRAEVERLIRPPAAVVRLRAVRTAHLRPNPVAARWVSKHSVELVDAIRAAFHEGTTPEQSALITEWVRQAVMR
jgi:hypothetical protein